MKINVWLDETINLYTVECENGNIYECLSQDEVQEVVKQELEDADKATKRSV